MDLLNFLRRCRTDQPERDSLFLFFGDRRFRGPLINAVCYGRKLAETTGEAFVWLCVTNAGVDYVNRTVLYSLGLLDDCLRYGFPSDPNAGQVAPFYAAPGVAIRLTRNLDKERGFVNGAMGHVEKILAYQDKRPIVFTVKLSSTGVLVLVHPIWHDGQRILPCTYGYATTIRRAQGATYYHGCLFFIIPILRMLDTAMSLRAASKANPVSISMARFAGLISSPFMTSGIGTTISRPAASSPTATMTRAMRRWMPMLMNTI